MSYTYENFSSTDDPIVDHILRNCPLGLLDCRSYYWRNFKYPGTIIRYNHHHFQHTISVGNIYPQSPGSSYVCTFNESMLLTWVGVECSVQRRLATAYSISVMDQIRLKTAVLLYLLIRKYPFQLIVMSLATFIR